MLETSPTQDSCVPVLARKVKHPYLEWVAKRTDSIPKADPRSLDVVPTDGHLDGRNSENSGNIQILDVEPEAVQLLQRKDTVGCPGMEQLKTTLRIAERQSGHQPHD